MPHEAIKPKSAHHLPALDGLRGIAILLVMAYHFVDLTHARATDYAPLTGFALKMCGAGWVGVDLFFVLSGFLITGILLDSRGAKSYYTNFFARRALRIFPLYYGILIALLVLLPLLWSPSGPAYRFLHDNQLWYWAYLSNGLIAKHGGFNGSTAGFFWSLAVEEQFYLVWPFVVASCSRRTLTRLCFALLATSFLLRVILTTVGVEAPILYVLPFTHPDPLVMGALLALAQRSSDARTISRRFLVPALSAVLVLVGLSLWRGEYRFWDRPTFVFGSTPLAVVFGAAVLWAARADLPAPINRLLIQRPLVSFGRLSYALYLFHVPMGFVVKAYLWDRIVPSAPILLVLALYLSVATAVTWVAAFLSWHLFEKHFLRLKKYFSTGPENVPRPVSINGAFVRAARAWLARWLPSSTT